jgi:hypothetical protein
MTESKKAWVTPELIVLVRSKPEEAVLVACKTRIDYSTSGSTNSDYSCTRVSCTALCDVLNST